MVNRQALILSIAGALCLLLSIRGGGLSAGYNIIGLSPILLRAGVIYLTLGVITYLLAPVTRRDGLLGTLCASGLVFMSGSIVMYYDLVLTPPPSGTPLTTHYLVGYQALALFVTLPTSAGYLSGVLVRTNRQDQTVAVLLGAAFGSGVAGSWVARSLGAQSMFMQLVLPFGILATAGLGMLPLAVMGGWNLVPESTLGGYE